MSNNFSHGLTATGDDGKPRVHPLYWVWQEKKKQYDMCDEWSDSVLEFYEWCITNQWEKGNSIRRYDTEEEFCPSNCYIHVRGTPIGEAK